MRNDKPGKASVSGRVKPRAKMALDIWRDSIFRKALNMTTDYHPFRYQNVTVIRVVDGDTVELEVDLGFKTRFRDNFRLIGVDTPERGHEGFTEATDYTKAWCDKYQEGGIELHSVKRDKYGRWLAILRSIETGAVLNDSLITEGMGKAYDGGKR